MKKPELKKHASKVVRKLKKLYPEAHCELTYKNPLQLLIATILSAQCTDKRVNQVTPGLFKRFPKAKDFAEADVSEIEELIRSTGFYRNKAKNIKNATQSIVNDHHGKVPQTLDELTQLGGVGRKTANVVLGNAFGIPGVVVDTHVTRLSNRLGLTKKKDAVKIEHELMEIIPKKDWIMLSHYLIFHGRQICKARKPDCQKCDLNQICPSAFRC